MRKPEETKDITLLGSQNTKYNYLNKFSNKLASIKSIRKKVRKKYR